MRRARFRYNVSIAIAGLVGFMGTVPLATAGFVDRANGYPWYAYPLLLILLIPIAVMVWGWRAGTDATDRGLRVRPYGVGGRRIAWSEITGIVRQDRRVYAVLGDESAVPLPGVSPDAIPRLVAAAGTQVETATSDDAPAAKHESAPADEGTAAADGKQAGEGTAAADGKQAGEGTAAADGEPADEGAAAEAAQAGNDDAPAEPTPADRTESRA